MTAKKLISILQTVEPECSVFVKLLDDSEHGKEHFKERIDDNYCIYIDAVTIGYRYDEEDDEKQSYVTLLIDIE